eukprot:2126013-Rhodomonas_salina.1
MTLVYWHNRDLCPERQAIRVITAWYMGWRVRRNRKKTEKEEAEKRIRLQKMRFRGLTSSERLRSRVEGSRGRGSRVKGPGSRVEGLSYGLGSKVSSLGSRV